MLSNERAVCQSTCFICVLQQTTPLLHTKDGLSRSSTAPGMGANTIWAQERHSFQPLQTLGLLGLEVSRPCIQIHVIRSLNCTMTPLPGTAVPLWSPTSVAAIMTVIGLLSILVAMEASAVLGQTSLSPGSVKRADFLLYLGASHATIPLCFSWALTCRVKYSTEKPCRQVSGHYQNTGDSQITSLCGKE